MGDYRDAAIDTRAKEMERLIRVYFDGCNEADVDKIVACFTEDAVHYFPPGMYEGPFRSARTIAAKWKFAVENFGSYWTVDRLLIQPLTWEAVMEWTHFKTKEGAILRGIEWYAFDERSGLIKEIRAYYASPQDRTLRTLALEGFDYVKRGYPMGPPPGAR